MLKNLVNYCTAKVRILIGLPKHTPVFVTNFFSTFARTFPLLRYCKDTAFSSNHQRVSGLFRFLFQYLKSVRLILLRQCKDTTFNATNQRYSGFYLFNKIFYYLSLIGRLEYTLPLSLLTPSPQTPFVCNTKILHFYRLT